MLFDMDTLSDTDTYKLLVSTIVPRPIAWISTRDLDGTINAAPFSFFNAMSGKPPIVCFGIGHQITPFVFVSKKDGPVKTIQDFKGHVATTWFTGANYVLEGVLAKAGVNPKDVNIQPQQVRATQFVEGKVDVFTATL